MRIILLVLALTLSACETVKGVGRDITAVGQTIDNAL